MTDLSSPEPAHPGNREDLGEFGRLLTPREAAAILRVNAKTVSRWAAEGKLPAVRTPGGHRRFRACDIRAITEDHNPPRAGHAETPGGRSHSGAPHVRDSS